MKAFHHFLQQFPYYTPELLEEIRPHLSERKLETGEYLLRHGQICREVVFIEKGLLRLYYLNDGKEVTNCFCKEDELATSYASMVSGEESDIAIQAVEPTDLWVFSYESLTELYKQNLFWQQLGRLAVERELLIVEKHNRMLRDLSATDRYKQVLEKESYLLQRVPLTYLATYLQLTPETLSRIRSKLART
ncbi:MAG: Crp/Fnr family transcriptional regulator [Bacteroidota bacterium]